MKEIDDIKRFSTEHHKLYHESIFKAHTDTISVITIGLIQLYVLMI
jgi:hypothetical protein